MKNALTVPARIGLVALSLAIALVPLLIALGVASGGPRANGLTLVLLTGSSIFTLSLALLIWYAIANKLIAVARMAAAAALTGLLALTSRIGPPLLPEWPISARILSLGVFFICFTALLVVAKRDLVTGLGGERVGALKDGADPRAG